MRPAWSIIFFTSSSGLGLGLAAWIVLGLVPLESATHLLAIAGFTFGLIGAGLFSSTLHLGHPERAWRALSQWRSSWLSREGVLAVVVMAALFIWFVYVHGGAVPPLWASAGVLILIIATVYATVDDIRFVENCRAVVSSVDAYLLSDVCGSWWPACSLLAVGDDWPACDGRDPAIGPAFAGSRMGCKADLVARCRCCGFWQQPCKCHRPFCVGRGAEHHATTHIGKLSTA
jgi:hypothetical protein